MSADMSARKWPTARGRLKIAVGIGAALMLATLASGAWLVLDQTWVAARKAAEVSLQRTAQLVENTVNRQLVQVDGALASLPALLTGLSGPGAEVTPDMARHVLRGFNVQIFALRDIMLVRPDGAVWATARPNGAQRSLPIEPSDLTGGHPGAVALVGPVRNPLTGEWALFMARPVVLPGIGPLTALGEIPLPFLVSLMAEADDEPGTRIMLERDNGLLLASLPHDELRIGKRTDAAISRLGRDGLAFEVPRAIAPVPMLAVTRPTLYSDISVAVTLDAATAMAGWRRDRDRLSVVVALAAALVITLAGAMLFALRREDWLHRAREETRLVLVNAVEAMSDGFVMWDKDDRLVACNERFRELYALSAPFIRPGATFEEIIRGGAERGQYPQAGDDIETFVRDVTAWHRGSTGALERLLPDGRWLLITERRTPQGGIVGIRTDITALKHAQAELAAAKDRAGDAVAEVRSQNLLFDTALNNMSHGLLMADADQRLIVCNRRFLHIFGLDEASIAPGTGTATIGRAIKAAGVFDGEALAAIRTRQQALADSREAGTFVASSADGRALSIAQQPMADGGWVATYEDVTSQQRAESRVRFLAHHDDLTRLPNRVLFRTRLESMLREADTPRPASLCDGLALLYLDLDRFKDVNDTLGHTAGDALLAAVGDRLRRCLATSDLVARLGGDEFAVACLLPDPSADSPAVARRIIDTLSAPYEIGGRTVTIGASIGIALGNRAGLDADTLLKDADMALYQAKARGRGIACRFEPEMETRLHARLEMETDLREALAREQFEIAYQPIFDLRADRVCGFEALLRWNHPARGAVSPGEFIPLAEETGLIDEIGAWVLHRACADTAGLPGQVKVAVNLSPAQLRSPALVATVMSALDRSGLHPSRLDLEITESALLENNEKNVALLGELRRLGLRVVLDDFGTGYSSLSHLRMFPFSKIKIDQSFVREMTTRADCAAIVESVVELADKLGMTTTAEGVETSQQLERIRRVGCAEAQGYLLGRPQSILHAAHRLATQTVSPRPRRVGRRVRKAG